MSSERSVQILISLLKQHGIRKIIASPGTTNITFIASVMNDPWFEIYSSVDERSAAYMACGLAEESREPVILSCTGATASRNYMPGLTEAYYRKIPILAITASQSEDKIGHLSAQLLDRSNVPNDIVRNSYSVRLTKDAEDEWANEIAINNAILELKRHGGGPVHLNFVTSYSRDYITEPIRDSRKIERIAYSDPMPQIPEGKIAVFVGSHREMTPELTKAINSFCESYNAVVLCDHTSGYYGDYRVQMALPFENNQCTSPLKDIDILIHIGEISGDYPTLSIRPKDVWRVSPDGEIKDFFRKLTKVFEMREEDFFESYATYATPNKLDKSSLKEYRELYDSTLEKIPELPFSNGWIAMHTAPKIPMHSVLHLGILNSLRNWNYFKLDPTIRTNSNVGGFGIDGIVSTLIGASLANPKKLHFTIVGDLAFFYDLNAIGNRHVSPNIRIMVINNGRGTEFRNYNHPGAAFGLDADSFIAAAGHYGNKSSKLLKHYAEDLGFEYLAAKNKDEFHKNIDHFTTSKLTERPMLFEVFTDSEDESDSLRILHSLNVDSNVKIKKLAHNILGEKGVKALKSVLGK